MKLFHHPLTEEDRNKKQVLCQSNLDTRARNNENENKEKYSELNISPSMMQMQCFSVNTSGIINSPFSVPSVTVAQQDCQNTSVNSPNSITEYTNSTNDIHEIHPRKNYQSQQFSNSKDPGTSTKEYIANQSQSILTISQFKTTFSGKMGSIKPYNPSIENVYCPVPILTKSSPISILPNSSSVPIFSKSNPIPILPKPSCSVPILPKSSSEVSILPKSSTVPISPKSITVPISLNVNLNTNNDNMQILEHYNKTTLKESSNEEESKDGQASMTLQNIETSKYNAFPAVSIESSQLNNITLTDDRTKSDSFENSSNCVHLIPATQLEKDASDIDNSNAIYVLLADESSIKTVTATNSSIDGISFSTENMKTIDPITTQTVQIMNSEGLPVQINVSDLLSTIHDSKSNVENKDEISPNLDTVSPGNINSQVATERVSQVQFLVPHPTVGLSEIPQWALTLRDCALYGDTYSGYVMNESEMEMVINMYKKDTQSIFAIRQTPSPAKDERIETIRLMWKSQYVPYDGIPFVNVGRRAVVMECEHGPRKRNNAIKRLIQVYGKNTTMKRIPNLTCPARLFVKKVRKFPQFRVPLNTDQKFLRHLQEQSLKLVRNAGYDSGEVRLYMQLPLPSAHRYHHIGNTVDAYERELEENKEFVLEEIAVDSRVLTKIQELVRQGFHNPFIVRAAMKDFVDNKLNLEENEKRPSKHDKTFYPPMIEIQNIIQQAKVALNNGILTPLPPPCGPPVPTKLKRKKIHSLDALKISIEPKLKSARKSLNPSRYNVATLEASQVSSADNSGNSFELGNSSDNNTSSESETLSISITRENHLDNLSVNNFSLVQLQQLAKIGLLALNNVSSKEEDSQTRIDTKTNEILNKNNVAEDIENTVNENMESCAIVKEIREDCSRDTVSNISENKLADNTELSNIGTT